MRAGVAEVAAPGDEVGVGFDEGEGVGTGVGDVGHWVVGIGVGEEVVERGKGT